jgi:hypothetical protein
VVHYLSLSFGCLVVCATALIWHLKGKQGSIYWKIPPPGGGEISADVNWGKKYEKVKRKRGENVKEKGRNGKEKGSKGKENEKRGSKRVK